MGKGRKRKRRFKARTIWMMVLAYFIAGGVVATLFLQDVVGDGTGTATGEPSLNNAWGMFPLVVIIWPVFLVVMIVRALL